MSCECFDHVRRYCGCGTDESISGILLATEALFTHKKYFDVEIDQYRYMHDEMTRYHAGKMYLQQASKVWYTVKDTDMFGDFANADLLDILFSLNIRFVKEKHFITVPSKLCCKTAILHRVCCLNAKYFEYLKTHVENFDQIYDLHEVSEFAIISHSEFIDDAVHTKENIDAIRTSVSLLIYYIIMPLFKVFLRMFKMFIYIYNDIWYLNNDYTILLSNSIVAASNFMRKSVSIQSPASLLFIFYELEDYVSSGFFVLKTLHSKISCLSTFVRDSLSSFVNDLSFLIPMERRNIVSKKNFPLTMTYILSLLDRAGAFPASREGNRTDLHLYGCHYPVSYYKHSYLPLVATINSETIYLKLIFKPRAFNLSDVECYYFSGEEQLFLDHAEEECSKESMLRVAVHFSFRLFSDLINRPIFCRIIQASILFFEDMDSSRCFDEMSPLLLAIIILYMMRLFAYQATANWSYCGKTQQDKAMEICAINLANEIKKYSQHDLLRIISSTDVSTPKMCLESRGSAIRQTYYEDCTYFMLYFIPVLTKNNFHKKLPISSLYEVAFLCKELFQCRTNGTKQNVTEMQTSLQVLSATEMYDQIEKKCRQLALRIDSDANDATFKHVADMLKCYGERVLCKKNLSPSGLQSLLRVFNHDRRYGRDYKWSTEEIL